MLRKIITFTSVLALAAAGFADTFKNLNTGEEFNGYATQRTRNGQTVVYVQGKGPRFVDLGNYEVIYNHAGREDVVYTFPINEPVNLVSVTQIFEQSIARASNEGPLLILIELDVASGHIDLIQRMCEAILRTANCPTVCYLSGGVNDGAYGDPTAIALACDRLFMRENTYLGGKPRRLTTLIRPEAESEYEQPQFDAQTMQNWYAYCAEIAGLNNRPTLLCRALVDPELKVLEVALDDRRIFIKPEEKNEDQRLIRTWGEEGMALRLTADQAASKAIADKVVPSRDAMLAELQAQQTRRVRDRQMIKARREYQRTKETLDEAKTNIDTIEQDIDVILEHYNAIDEEFRRLNKLTFMARPPGTIARLDALMVERDIVLEDLLAAFNTLIAEYERAIAIAEENPDLRDETRTLQEELDQARERRSEIIRRPMF